MNDLDPFDLWFQARKGDRRALNRRVYTVDGRRTFDAIQQRFEQDKTFRQEVSDYISSFEALLDQISRDDRDHQLARTYLNSDTGKVYLMLAHAAGRFAA